MPAVRFSVTWPDNETTLYYSPSTVIHEYIAPKTSLSLADFLSTMDKALDAASQRVYERYGYYCSAASDEKTKIKTKGKILLDKNITGDVTINHV